MSESENEDPNDIGPPDHSAAQILATYDWDSWSWWTPRFSELMNLTRCYKDMERQRDEALQNLHRQRVKEATARCIENHREAFVRLANS